MTQDRADAIAKTPLTTPEPPPALALLELATGKWVTHAIAAAADLNLADLLKDGPRSAEDLARATSTHAPSLYRLLRALSTVGVLEDVGRRRFALTPVGAALRSDVPGSMRAMARMLGSESHTLAWVHLIHAVRTGGDPWAHANGAPLWDYLAAHPEEAEIFNDAMTGLSGPQAVAVVGSYDFSTAGRIVDVGGGHGDLLTAVLRASPKAEGVVFDLPEVAEGARARLAEAGLQGRARALGGDFFRDAPPAGDLYLLKHVLHDWDDERALALLRNVRGAMPAGAKLLVIEMVIPDGPEPHFGKLLDLEMLIGGPALERTEGEYRDLLTRAGFRVARIVPTPSDLSLIEVERA